MREIKFRAWLDYENKFAYRDNSWGYDDWMFWGVVHWYPLCQYTWLKDKNWKEIYEGDILNKHFPKVKPIWQKIIDEIEKDNDYTKYNFFVHPSLIHWRKAYDERFEVKIPNIYNNEFVDEYEIIWNIYENPELLTPNKTDE